LRKEAQPPGADRGRDLLGHSSIAVTDGYRIEIGRG
jgi:hypothetical protein